MSIVHLTIFHTSDEHGHIENAARIVRMVRDAETQNPGGVMLVSSGDFFQGSALSDLLGPEPSEKLLNDSGYRYLALGNHDFDLGPDFTQQWINHSKATVLAANVVDGRTGQLLPGTKACDVTTLKGVKLGFFGLTTPETASIAFPGTLGTIKFTDPVAAGQKAVDELHQQGVKIIFSLSHLGDGDTDFATHVPGVEILGGHVHIPWDHPEVVGGDNIFRPGAFRDTLTRIDMDVDTDSQSIVHLESKLIKVQPSDAEAPDIAATADGFLAAMDQQTKQVMFKLPHALQHVDRGTDEVDPLLVQAMLKKTGADEAMVNDQFVREGLPAGDVSEGDILNVMPFTNRLQTGEVTAADLAHALTLSEQRHDETSLSSASANNRYVLKDGQIFDTEAGQFVPPTQKLKIASTDYLLSGGLSYFTPQANPVPPLAPLREVFTTAVQDGTIQVA